MTCSSCKNLIESDKKEGALCGARYYCKKMKCYVDGSSPCCSNYEKSYSRSNYTCSDIYNDGEKFSDDDRPISFHIIMLILVIIFGLLITLLNSLSM